MHSQEDPPAKASRKTKEKVAKVNLSPFAKKEKNRRKKSEKAVMHQEPEEDQMIQALCLQHMRNVETMKYEEVKDYLREKLTNKNAKQFKLDEYWGRTACGIKVPELGDGSAKKAPQIAYFKPFGTAPPGWNFGMALVYVAASLMATRLHQPTLFSEIHYLIGLLVGLVFNIVTQHWRNTYGFLYEAKMTYWIRVSHGWITQYNLYMCMHY